MDKCLLCRRGGEEDGGPFVDNLNPCLKQRLSRDEDTSDGFKVWAERCIVSMCRVLKIPKSHPLKDFLLEAEYCADCTQLIRDIEFTLKQLDRLQKDMIRFRDELVSKLGSNYSRIRNIQEITVQYEDIGSSKASINNKENFLFDEVVKMIYEKTEKEKCGWTEIDFMRHKGSLNRNKTELSSYIIEEGVCIKEEINFHEGSSHEEDFDNMLEIPQVIMPEKITRVTYRKRDRKAKQKVDFSKYENDEDDDWDDGGLMSEADEHDSPELEHRNDDFSIDPDWDESNSSDSASHEGRRKSKRTTILKTTGKIDRKIKRKNRTQARQRILFDCPDKICGRGFDTEEDMLSHVQKIHKENSPEGPESNGFDSNDDVSLRESRGEEKPNTENKKRIAQKKRNRNFIRRGFHCPEKNCGRGFDKKDYLLSHMRKIHEGDASPYHCAQCDLRFAKRDKLRWHEKSKHPSISKRQSDTNDVFSCATTTCRKMFSSKEALMIHTQKIHSEGPAFQCDECGEKFSTVPTLKYHLDKHKAGEGGAVCSVCNKGFTTEAGMRSHMKRTHTGPVKKCSFCGLTKNSDQEVEEHEAEHKKREIPFSCLECDQYFTSSTDLIHHMVTHDDTRCMCDVCGLLLATKRSLESHRKIHDDTITRFQCKECGRKCASNAMLERHNASHTGERKHVCEKCGKTFKYTSALLLHMRRHDNITPFKCKICGKGFIASHYMKKHEQIHSGILAYQCKFCEKRFRAESNLYQHERTHGPDNPNKKPRVRANKPRSNTTRKNNTQQETDASLSRPRFSKNQPEGDDTSPENSEAEADKESPGFYHMEAPHQEKASSSTYRSPESSDPHLFAVVHMPVL